VAERTRHESCVDTWLERSSARGLPREALMDLFEAAVVALWARTSTTLGDVTLTAIADRILHQAAEKYPAFASLSIDADGRLAAHGLRSNMDAINHLKLVEGMRSVLVDFLTVVGNLTADLLTADLHAELRSVTLDADARPAASPPERPKAARRQRGAR